MQNEPGSSLSRLEILHCRCFQHIETVETGEAAGRASIISTLFAKARKQAGEFQPSITGPNNTANPAKPSAARRNGVNTPINA